eukprot:scaffold16175_cov43-Prasinocladus_malaysianus.AAC.1
MAALLSHRFICQFFSRKASRLLYLLSWLIANKHQASLQTAVAKNTQKTQQQQLKYSTGLNP